MEELIVKAWINKFGIFKHQKKVGHADRVLKSLRLQGVLTTKINVYFSNLMPRVQTITVLVLATIRLP